MPVSRRASRPASTVTIRSRCALLTIAVDGHRCLHTYATCSIIFFVTHGARGWRTPGADRLRLRRTGLPADRSAAQRPDHPGRAAGGRAAPVRQRDAGQPGRHPGHLPARGRPVARGGPGGDPHGQGHVRRGGADAAGDRPVGRRPGDRPDADGSRTRATRHRADPGARGHPGRRRRGSVPGGGHRVPGPA
jgi:hypothetical protein